MKPILFPENATQFNTNGLGRLDCLSCVVVEERNGEYTLSMEIAETTLHASEIKLSSIIVAKPSDGATLQAFRVYKITKPLGGQFSVLAQHISYQLSYIPTMPFTILASPQACAQTLAALKSNAVESCPFNFSTDVVTGASYSQTLPASIRSRLGGVEGSVLDQFGGEYEWNNFNVILHKNRGVTVPNVSLRYGKNITDLNQETNIENTLTGIVPYWSSNDTETVITLPEKVVESPNASRFPFKRTVPMDFSQDFEEEPTEQQLRARAQHYVNASGVGIPDVSIKLSFINLADTEEYKNLAALQTVKLCDNVEVYFERLDIATTAKIVRTEYDVLLERYNSVEIGSLRSTLAGVISSTESALSQVVNNTRNMFKSYSNDVKELIDNATSWLTSSGGYVIAVKNEDGSWKELLFMSTNDVEDPTAKVLRINENGMGFSSTGVAGPYTQAWTLDGKMVIGGTNVPSLTVYDDNNQVLFQINKNGMQWKATNSEMATNGTFTIKDSNGNYVAVLNTSGLTMYNGTHTSALDADIIGKWGSSGIDVKKGSISGSSVKVGTNSTTPGSITIYNGNGDQPANEIGHWTKDGIDVKKGSISGSSVKVGTNSTNPGSITIYNGNGDQPANEIGHWTKDGIDVKKGSISGSSVKVGGNGDNPGAITVYNQYGTADVNIIGKWDRNGIKVYSGSIDGPSITVGGKDNKDGSITVKGSDNTTNIGIWNEDGLTINGGNLTVNGGGTINGANINLNNSGKITITDANGTIVGEFGPDGIKVYDGSIEGTSLTVGGSNNEDGTITVNNNSGQEIGKWDKDGLDVDEGIITGATVRSNASGKRIQMDRSYTLKGIDDIESVCNFIDMMQPDSTEMNIGASNSLNIMTPQLAVGTSTSGDVTVAKTTSASDPDLPNPNRRLYNVRKIYLNHEDHDPWADYYNVQNKMQMGWVPFYNKDETTGEITGIFDYVYCTLPVMLLLEGDDESLIHGMVTTNSTFTPQINI